jgi:hypothetical protein
VFLFFFSSFLLFFFSFFQAMDRDGGSTEKEKVLVDENKRLTLTVQELSARVAQAMAVSQIGKSFSGSGGGGGGGIVQLLAKSGAEGGAGGGVSGGGNGEEVDKTTVSISDAANRAMWR